MAESGLALTTEKIDRDSEEKRIIQAARQDPKAFGELYKLYVQQVFRYLYSRLGNVHETEDVTAQTFLAAFESFDRFRQNGHFSSWLFSIARNKAMDHFRKSKNSTSIEVAGDLPVDDDPLSRAIQSEQATALSVLIQELPEEERELLRLRFLAEMSFPEIARFLHRSEDAVKKSTYRLLARLHSQLEVNNE
jgi:RNA polymerase sigma-70 factor, ECF subfamily